MANQGKLLSKLKVPCVTSKLSGFCNLQIVLLGDKIVCVTRALEFLRSSAVSFFGSLVVASKFDESWLRCSFVHYASSSSSRTNTIVEKFKSAQLQWSMLSPSPFLPLSHTHACSSQKEMIHVIILLDVKIQ